MNELFDTGPQEFVGDLSRKQTRQIKRFLCNKRFASFLVDLGNTTEYKTSLVNQSGASTAVGGIVDLLGAATYTNVWVAGNGSGELPILVQTSDATTSGSFTDPTSGLPLSVFPIAGRMVSGGIFWANSGLHGSGVNAGPNSPVISGAPIFSSGGIAIASFNRPHRYARLICTSGNASLTAVPFQAGFIGQRIVTGSGAGYSLAPGSGTVNV